MEKITVLGIGNILLGDEGLGVRAVELLTKRFQLPPEVQVLDGGCLGMELYPFLDGTTKLLVVDAIDAQLLAGDCSKICGEDVLKYFRNKLSVHEIGISEVLAALDLVGCPIREVVIIGIKPAVLDVGLELSDIVLSALPRLVDLIADQLREWHVSILKLY
jgi:hydrogenase maturation protease